MSQMGGAPLDFPGGGLAALRGGPEEGEAGGDGDGGLKDASGLADVRSVPGAICLRFLVY